MDWDLESLDRGELHFSPACPLVLKLSASFCSSCLQLLNGNLKEQPLPFLQFYSEFFGIFHEVTNSQHLHPPTTWGW